jgi:hypothetical protein
MKAESRLARYRTFDSARNAFASKPGYEGPLKHRKFVGLVSFCDQLSAGIDGTV